MPTVAQRLRQLDRRVLREGTPIDAAKWAKAAKRWRLQLGLGIITAAIIPLNVAVGNKWFGMALLPTVLIVTFQAGRMCAEHERLTGKRTFGGRPRPPGI